MIIVIADVWDVTDHLNIPTGKKELLVSHGYDTYTGKTIILPQEHPRHIGAKFDMEMGEWVMD